jgi:hypothetical protein
VQHIVECSPSICIKRAGRPSSFASSSCGRILRLSAFQAMRHSAGTPCLAQLASKRPMTSGLGQSKRSIANAFSPEAKACASAMKKRPSNGPISATGPATPIAVCMRSSPQQMAAAKRDDIPGTSE